MKKKIMEGVQLNGRKYKNYIDGHNQLDYLTGKSDKSVRKEFIYVTDEGQIACIRWGDWKSVYLENRGRGFGVWREPFTELRAPLIFNLRRDPYERAQHNANTYDDWWLDRPYILFGLSDVAMKFLLTFDEYPASQTAGSFNLESVKKKIEAAHAGK